MSNLGLYSIIVLVWGTTWFAIKLQLGVVAPEVSVGYRFTLAGLLLLAYTFSTQRRSLSLFKKRSVWTWVIVQGFFMFSINYALTYVASAKLTSGLVAVIFSLITVMNAANARVFLKQKLESNTAVAIALGFLGIILFFAEDIFSAGAGFLSGAGVALLATYIASLGNMAAVKVREQQVPIIPGTAISMSIGGLATLLYSAFRGYAFQFDWTPAYVGSLLYLTIFGSIVAFYSYLLLLSRIGPSRASYCAVLFPVVALFISALLEGYRLMPISIVGFCLILIGNVFALSSRNLTQLIAKRFQKNRGVYDSNLKL